MYVNLFIINEFELSYAKEYGQEEKAGLTFFNVNKLITPRLREIILSYAVLYQ